MKRRNFLANVGAGVVAASAANLRAAQGEFEVTRTDAEWRAMLSDIEYDVMRNHGTERPFTSPLDTEKRAGTFICRGCDLPLYDAATKYDSGTGWPSFYAPIENAVGTTKDFKLLIPRTEVHCRRCGSHLGHVFNDGPAPTGKRYCMNGVSMTFVAA